MIRLIQRFKVVLGIVITGTLFFSSCKKVDINFNSQFVDNNYTQIVKVDTITPELYNIFVDSFTTSGTGTALAGMYRDPAFGLVTAKSFFEFGVPTDLTISSTSTFDSLILVLKLNKSYYGDTTKPIHLSVFRLTEPVLPKGNNVSFYNKDKLSYDSTHPLGHIDIVVQPNNTDTVSIRIDNTGLGKEFFKLMQSTDQNISNNTKFINYFNGLCVVPTGEGVMVGFKDSISMRLHYESPDQITQAARKDFNLTSPGHQFNNITVDRGMTDLKDLKQSNPIISSVHTNNIGYLQSITGSVVKVMFPTAQSILNANGYVKLTQANLIIRPIISSYDGFYPLPPQLRLSQTDVNNQQGSDLAAATAGTASTQTGNLVIDYQYGANTAYTYDLTAYLTAQLAITLNNEDGLLISMPAPANNTTFNRVLIGDSFNQKNKIQLVLYYLSVQ